MARLSQFKHERDPTQVDEQNIIRMNSDTLYSVGIFDLTAPVVIDMPASEGRFQSLLAINQDHYVVGLEHDAGSYTFTQDISFVSISRGLKSLTIAGAFLTPSL